MTGLVIAGSLTVYAGYRDALAIDTEEINTDAWGERPDQIEGIHNILLLGGDEESEGKRPDVLVLVNINVDQDSVTMVNIPRDMMVDIPRCDAVDEYPGWAGGIDQVNHAAAYGGLDCLGHTVETVTDIHLDHMVTVDFSGFEDIVNTLGGVELCIPEPIDDVKAHLELDAGMQTLSGEEALGLARSRNSTEFRNDMGRIESQQRLIGAILRKVTSDGTLSSPTTVYEFLRSVTDSLSADDGLTTDRMAELAIAMREVDLDRVNMVMVPVEKSRFNEDKVDPRLPEAAELFAAVAAGEALPDEGVEEGDEENGQAEAPAVEPGDVSVRVLNGVGETGLASAVEALLANDYGFDVTGIGEPGERDPDLTTIYHSPEREAHAQVLASYLVNSQLEEVADFGDELELVMKPQDWEGLTDGRETAGADEADGGDDVLEELGATSAVEDTVDC
ncbi:LCP family protein [Nocardiopsis ganjiahuensis]|uniref:LCP family protein n=1 Tax=Nocardiopsis ganjiahuensis TaxID=239984 RepID=UPI00034D688B|nr:LCP family protein [Nocardiopsis ganjiahuensis]